MVLEDVVDMTRSQLEEKFLYKKVLLKDNLEYDKLYDGMNINESIASRSNSVVTITSIWWSDKQHLPRFEISEDNGWCTYNMELVEAFVEEIDDEEQIEIQIGDLCRIKEDASELKIKKTRRKYNGLKIYQVTKQCEGIREEMKGALVIVRNITNGVVVPYYLNNDYKNGIIPVSCLEVIEKDCVNELKKKQQEGTIKDDGKKILEDLDTMQEMISKVNEKDLRKIYAGATGNIPNNLKGIELILNQWAYNKMHIYRMFGNKLSITKQLEYEKDASNVKTDIELIKKEFPGTWWIFKELDANEILENKLHHNMTNSWTQYARRYNSGDKVSKMFDEVFKNDKLNTLYSDIIAQNKIKGFIEISIDPIEYLLMSTNVSGWNSCHRIYDNYVNTYGCYSGGIFSYMCDKASLIAFRHDGKLYDYQIENQKVKAFSKNWRQMVWLKEDFTMFTPSRQYPNYFEEITKEVREMLEEQINEYTKNDIAWVHTSDKDKIKRYVEDIRIKRMKMSNRENVLHYNDILNGFDCDMCYRKDIDLEEYYRDKITIMIGSYPVCPICGREILTIHDLPFGKDCYNNRKNKMDDEYDDYEEDDD